MNKINLIISSALFFIFIFLIIPQFTAKAEITYIENGWMKGDFEEEESLLNNYSNHNIKDGLLTITKKQGFDSYALTKNYDTKNIPIKYYIKTRNLTTGRYDFNLVREEKYDINSKGINLYNWENNGKYICKIGYGTITYWGANNRIVVDDQETSLDQIYNTVVSNGWNNFWKIDDDVFIMDCELFIGNGSGNKAYLNMTEQILISNNSDGSSINFLEISTDGEFNVDRCAFLLENNLTQTKDFNLKGNCKFYNTTFYGGMTTHRLFIYCASSGLKYFNSSSFINCQYQSNNGGNMYNMFISDQQYGMWSPDTNTEEYNNILISNCQYGIYASGTKHVVMENITFVDCTTGDVRGHNQAYYNLTNCNSNRDNKTLKWYWIGSNQIDSYLFYDINLKTDSSTDIRIWNKTGRLIYSEDGCNGFVNTTLLYATYNVSLGHFGHRSEYPYTLRIEKDDYITYNKTFNNEFDIGNLEIYLVAEEGALGNMIVSLETSTELFFFIIWIILFWLCFSPKHDYLINVVAGIFLTLFSLVMFNTYTLFQDQNFLLLSFTISVIAMFSGFLVKKPLKKKG